MPRGLSTSQRLLRARLGRRRALSSGATMVLGGVVLGLVGCSTGNKQSRNTSAASASTSRATVASSPGSSVTTSIPPVGAATRAAGTPSAVQPKRGGTYVSNSPLAWAPNQDPHLNSNLPLSTLIYSRLLKSYPLTDPGDIKPQGDLAKSWEQPDAKTIIFHLNNGYLWQNIAPVNGRPVTADDVIYSLGRQRDLKFTAGVLAAVDKITASDQATVRMDLSKADADIITSLCDGRNVTVAKETVDVHGDLKQGPYVGSGPFVLADLQQNQSVTFARNPTYFYKERPYIDKLQVLNVTDAATNQAAFRNKQIFDWGYNATPDDFKQMMKDVPAAVLVNYKDGHGPTIWLPCSKAPTSDVRVRQGINKLLNRQEVIDGILSGLGWWTLGVPVPQQDWLLSEAELKRTWAFDPAGAKALFGQAGFTGWNATMSVFNLEPYISSAQLLQQQLAAGGVKTTIKLIDASSIVSQVYTSDNFEIAIPPMQPQSTFNSDMYYHYHSTSTANGAKINDARLDQLIEQQQGELDAAKRKAMVQDVQRRLIEIAAINRVSGLVSQRLTQSFVKDLGATTITGAGVYGENSHWEYVWLNL